MHVIVKWKDENGHPKEVKTTFQIVVDACLTLGEKDCLIAGSKMLKEGKPMIMHGYEVHPIPGENYA